MRTARLTLGVILIALLIGVASPPPARAAPVWTPAAPLGSARAGHAATILPDGQVLVVGGIGGADTAERYDPAANAWQPAGRMATLRGEVAIAPLADGRVLAVGASGGTGSVAAERYDAATNTWQQVAAPPLAPYGTLTTLADGRALYISAGQAAVYAPATDTWTPTGPLSARAGGNRHAATALPDGRILVTGGIRGDCVKTGCLNATAERYDPATNGWATVTPMRQARADHRTAVLADGGVLVVGDYGDSRLPERYDPATDTWADAGALPIGFVSGGQSLTALPGNRALLVTSTFGPSPSPVATALIFDGATAAWQPIDASGIPRLNHTATLLRDGRMLVTGGTYGGNSAEHYGDPRQSGACFAETGQCIDGAFLAYWRANGGLARHGFPLTAERWEILEDGKPYVVQYFERARFEHHPENAPPFDVLLGQFGRSLYLLDPSLPRANAAPPLPGATYFEETGHNLQGRFRDYWLANGGLAQLGYPLSEEIEERLEDGQTYRVQYFERARLEYHPENTAPYEMQLGQFGRRILATRSPVGRLPHQLSDRFAPVYAANQGIRTRLNAPTGEWAQVGGAILQFERGWMIYRADTRTIYALVSAADKGSIPIGAVFAFPDTWDESQPTGGGSGPQPGLHEPQRGFGKVWRENPLLRGNLGYALAPNEQGQTLTVQSFVGGLVLDAPALTNYGQRGLTFIAYTNGRYEVQYFGP